MLLNQLLIIPSLSNHDFPIVSYFLNLGSAWQVITAASIVLVVSYLLLSTTDVIRDLMSDKLWQHAPLLSNLFIRLQKSKWEKKYSSLKEEKETKETFQKSSDFWKVSFKDLGTEVDDKNQFNEAISPTTLGNILKQTA